MESENRLPQSSGDVTPGGRFREIFRAYPTPSLVLSAAESRVLELNDEACKFLGRSREEIVGRTVSELQLCANAAEGERIFGPSGEVRSFRDVEMQFRLKSGEFRDALLSMETLTLEGRPVLLVALPDVTERLRSASQLRNRDRALRTLINNLPGIVYRCANDRDWTFEYVSRDIFSLTGYLPADFLEHRITFGRLIHPDDRDSVWSEVQAALKERRPYRLQYRIRAADGNEKWVWEQGVGVLDHDGTLLALEGYIADITAFKHAEQDRERLLVEASAERSLLQMVLRLLPAGVIFAGPSGSLIMANDQVEKILGHPFRSVTTIDDYRVYSAYHPDGRPFEPREWPMARSLLTGEVVTNEEIHYLRGDGKRVVLLANSAPVVDGAGRVTGAILSFTDVTEREAAAENIRRLEKRFSAIFIASPVAISLARAADQRYLDVNETWCRFFGYEREDVIGRTLGEFETYEKETLDRMNEALGRSGSIQDLAARIRRKSGEIRDALITVEPLNIGGETVLLRTLVDVSELQRAQAEIRSLNEGLEQKVLERTQRLEETLKELESFSYTVAHDLRAPLRAMRGYCSILMEDFGRALGDEGRRSVGRIIAAGEQLETLIRDLLEYSRLARDKMQLAFVDLDDVLSGVVGRLRETVGERKPEISLVSPMPPVVGDRLMLAQALTNLLSNAVKFVSPGVQPRVTVRAERRDGKVRIWIEDNGIGIPREHHQTIFSVFRRLHGQEEYPGTGIGLSIVRKSVERMDGKVGLESEPGKGSRFWIELPAADDRPSPER